MTGGHHLSIAGAGPRLMVLAAAVLFSTGGAVIKATGFSGWQVASLRCGIAALALWILLPTSRRNWTYKTWLVGCAYAAALITYAVANKLTTAANTIFLYSTTPLYILFLGPLLLKEPLRRRDLVFVAVFAVGLVLVFLDADPVFATAPEPFKGNLLATVGGLSFALVVMGLRWLSRSGRPGQTPAAGALVAGNIIAFLVCLPSAWPITSSSPKDWLLVSYLGIFQMGLAYLLLTAALLRVPALEASLLILIEPVLNPIWAWWVHGERPGPLAISGGGIILVTAAGLALLSVWLARQDASATTPSGQ